MDKDWQPEHRPAGAPPAKNKKEVLNDEEIAEIAQDEFSDSKPSKHQSMFDEDKPARKRTGSKKIWWILLALIVIGVLAFTVIIPGLQGYSVYKAMKASGVPAEYATNMAGLQQSKEDAEAASAKAAESVTACQAAQQQAQDAQTAAENRAQAFSDAADNMQEERDACKDTLKEQTDSLADAANRLCCISKFTNPAITGFDSTGNTVTCVTDGGTALSC